MQEYLSKTERIQNHIKEILADEQKHSTKEIIEYHILISTEKERYNRILKNADDVIEISQHYFKGCYQKRNIWMVEKSSLIIAVLDGGNGGKKHS